MRFNAVRMALGQELWIQSWQNGKITIRGWKDRIAAFVEGAPPRPDGKRLTAPEIVADRLKGVGLDEKVRAKWPVDPDSVKVTDLTSFGKEGCVEQFVVELKFK